MQNFEELPRLKDSISYLYIEHAVIQQDNLSIVAIDQNGTTPIPIASVTCLLLGPGVKITHAAIRAICNNGCMAIWCGEHMGRFYASGIGETRSSKNLLKQAAACMDEKRHMEAVRRMYQLRFPNIQTEGLTLQQIRGMEGIRVRKAYALAAKTTGITWKNGLIKRQIGTIRIRSIRRFQRQMRCYMGYAMRQLFHLDILLDSGLCIPGNSFLLYMM